MVKVNGVRDAEKVMQVALKELIDEGCLNRSARSTRKYLLYDYEFARESVLGDYPDIIRAGRLFGFCE